MPVDYTKTILGRVKQILIDGTAYPVENTGVGVTQVCEYSIKPVVGSAAPRKAILRQYYRVDALLLENTLANLKIMWNLSGTVTVTGTFQTLQLGLESTLSVHTLQVHGYVYGINKFRRYIFNKACSFETKPQQHAATGLVLIPASFYCYADEAQPAGQEFGRIEQDT